MDRVIFQMFHVKHFGSGATKNFSEERMAIEVFFSLLGSACELGAVSIGLAVSAAADRATADMRGWGRCLGSHISKMFHVKHFGDVRRKCFRVYRRKFSLIANESETRKTQRVFSSRNVSCETFLQKESGGDLRLFFC